MKPVFEAVAKAKAKQAEGGKEKVPQKSAEPIETRQEVAKAKQVRKAESVRQNSDEQIRTDEMLAKAANVSRDTIRKVESITENAAPELIEAARTGEVSINAAAAKGLPNHDGSRHFIYSV